MAVISLYSRSQLYPAPFSFDVCTILVRGADIVANECSLYLSLLPLTFLPEGIFNKKEIIEKGSDCQCPLYA